MSVDIWLNVMEAQWTFDQPMGILEVRDTEYTDEIEGTWSSIARLNYV